jgi:hypothetical protein
MYILSYLVGLLGRTPGTIRQRTQDLGLQQRSWEKGEEEQS